MMEIVSYSCFHLYTTASMTSTALTLLVTIIEDYKLVSVILVNAI